MTTSITKGQVARRAWQIRPTLLETAGAVLVILAVHVWVHLPILAGVVSYLVVVALIATVTAVAELRQEAEDATERRTPPESEGPDAA
ncbi:hypothetical protein [Sphaerisporangium rhizosphaerae]|uniref:Uncharacterized protein n=1 Tax=Sphaerisporangium rhizosphaerae TaxID=2269375 RepID=A0ABW2P0Y5_9ACTN